MSNRILLTILSRSVRFGLFLTIALQLIGCCHRFSAFTQAAVSLPAGPIVIYGTPTKPGSVDVTVSVAPDICRCGDACKFQVVTHPTNNWPEHTNLSPIPPFGGIQQPPAKQPVVRLTYSPQASDPPQTRGTFTVVRVSAPECNDYSLVFAKEPYPTVDLLGLKVEDPPKIGFFVSGQPAEPIVLPLGAPVNIELRGSNTAPMKVRIQDHTFRDIGFGKPKDAHVTISGSPKGAVLCECDPLQPQRFSFNMTQTAPADSDMMAIDLVAIGDVIDGAGNVVVAAAAEAHLKVVLQSETKLDFGQVIEDSCLALPLRLSTSGPPVMQRIDDLSSGSSTRPSWCLETGSYTVTTRNPVEVPQVFRPKKDVGTVETRLEISDPNKSTIVILKGTGVSLAGTRGITDIAGFDHAISGWRVQPLGSGGSIPLATFDPLPVFSGPHAGSTLAADFDGDGWTDIAGWNSDAGGWHVALSRANSFDPDAPIPFIKVGSIAPGTTLTGNFDRTAGADLAGWNDADGCWWVASTTTNARPWICGFGGPAPGFMLTGDFDADGLTDIAGWNDEAKGWHVAVSDGNRFDADAPIPFIHCGDARPGHTLTGEFDRIPGTDIAGWNEPDGCWWVASATSPAREWICGFGGPFPGFMLTGNFDGDGGCLTDIAGWNEDAKGWHVAVSDGNRFDADAPIPFILNIGSPNAGEALTGDFATAAPLGCNANLTTCR